MFFPYRSSTISLLLRGAQTSLLSLNNCNKSFVAVGMPRGFRADRCQCLKRTLPFTMLDPCIFTTASMHFFGSSLYPLEILCFQLCNHRSHPSSPASQNSRSLATLTDWHPSQHGNPLQSTSLHRFGPTHWLVQCSCLSIPGKFLGLISQNPSSSESSRSHISISWFVLIHLR